jgi:O-antigen/teichoic acid export membrane protein
MTSRTKKSAWNFGSGLAFTAVTLAVGVFSTPLLLRWLGAVQFGAFRVLTDYGAYLALLDLGLAGALSARLAVAIGRGDANNTRALVVAGLRLYLVPTFLIALVGGLWIWALPHLIAADAIGVGRLRLAGLVFLIPSLLTPLLVFRWVVESEQRTYLITALLTGQSLSMTVLLVGAAWMGWGLLGQVAAAGAVQIGFVLAVCLLVLHRYPGIFRERAAAEVKSDLWSLNWPTFVFNLTGRVGLLTDNLVVAWALGPAAVAAFFLTQRLAQIALGQLQGIGNATWAGLVELYAQRQEENFRERLLELTSLVSSLSICVLAPIAAYNHHFIARWVGAATFAGEAVSVLACVNIWFWAVFSLWGWPISGTGNIRRYMPYAMVCAAVNLAVSIAGVLRFGLVGPLAGTLAGFVLIQSWAMTRVLGQLFGIKAGALWRAALSPFLWGAPLLAALWFVGHRHTPQGWIMLLGEMAVAGMIGLLLWWTIQLPAERRSLWWGRVRIALGQ